MKSFQRVAAPSWIALLLAASCLGALPALCNAASPAGPDDSINTVHVIFSNHLDIGYDGITPELGFDNNVVNKYFNVFFPLMVSVAEDFAKAFAPERFVFTTHAYLISLYLDCPLGMGFDCPGKEAVDNFTAAMQRGDVTWHAYPFNGELELADPSLIEFAVDLVHELDAKFNQPIKTTLSQRDVPGFTRAALPILVKKGIKAINLGVNGGSAPPGVPKNTPFIWKDPASGAQVFAAWHPGDYGGITYADCVKVDGFSHALCPMWRQDNLGPPPDINDINETLSFIRTQFPGAEVKASTFEEYMTHLEAAAPAMNLPVVTGEIGDTWVFGVQSDPLKVMEYRMIQRMRTGCLKDKTCDNKDPAFKNFSRILLKVHEHTWGVDLFQTLHDFVNYSNPDFHAALSEKRQNYQDCIHSWVRQALYNRWAVEALPHDHPISQGIRSELLSLEAVKKSPQTYGQHADRHSLSNGPLRFESDVWVLEVDPEKGSLSRLQRFWPDEQRLGVNWAGGDDSSFARILYSAYDEGSYDVVWQNYEYNHQFGWFEAAFGKPNCSLGNAKQAEIYADLTDALSATDPVTGALVVLLQYTFPEWAVQDAGAPAAMWTVIHMHSSSKHHGHHPYPHPHPHADPGDLHIDVMWVNKTATRLPEALWLQFQPGSGAVDPDSWTMNKLGQYIKPHEVILNGSMSQHVVQEEGVKVLSAEHSEELTIGSLDASLVSPGVPTVMPIVANLPDMTKGMSYNLVNNVWGTNYIMWIPYTNRDVNLAFRFIMKARKLAAPE